MDNQPSAFEPLAHLHPRSLKYLSDQLQSLIRGRLWLQVLIEPGRYIDATTLRSTLDNVPTTAMPTAPTPPSLSELPHTFITLLPSNPLSSMVESNMLQVVIWWQPS